MSCDLITNETQTRRKARIRICDINKLKPCVHEARATLNALQKPKAALLTTSEQEVKIMRELAIDEFDTVAGANAGAAVPAAVAVVGGIVAAHYGEKALNAFDDWVVDKYDQVRAWTAQQLADFYYRYVWNPSY